MQETQFSEDDDDDKPGDAPAFTQTHEDIEADPFADPPTFTQDVKFSRVDQSMEDIVEAEARPPIENYVGIGYDLLRGNPEGDFTLGGHDPGLRLRSIFKLTDRNGRPISHGSQTVPQQIEYKPVHSCSSAHSVKAFSGTKSYQKKLDVSVNLEGMTDNGDQCSESRRLTIDEL